MADIIKQVFKNHQDKLIGRAMAEHCDKRIEKVTKAIDREEKYLRRTLRSKNAGGIMAGDIEGAFHGLRESLGPRHTKATRVRT